MGINHLPIEHPGPYAGSHFVARKLQQAPSIEQAVDFYNHIP
ncbi:hypothetical protein [Bifidobacterium oedipodis]|nr:hypothetical protein [Bifidobacterium sp. DSM 109957]